MNSLTNFFLQDCWRFPNNYKATRKNNVFQLTFPECWTSLFSLFFQALLWFATFDEFSFIRTSNFQKFLEALSCSAFQGMFSTTQSSLWVMVKQFFRQRASSGHPIWCLQTLTQGQIKWALFKKGLFWGSQIPGGFTFCSPFLKWGPAKTEAVS